MRGKCCTGPRSGYPGLTTYAKRCLVTLLPWVFIQSECTGGVSLHLEITRKRLHLFHESGHIHYAKLVNLYHQKMCALHGQGWIPFLNRGRLLYHLIQRQVLGGVWSDMTTERVLTRTKLVSGGLIWGCRITENTLAKWVLASLYTTVYSNWGAQWQPSWVLWAILWGMSPHRLENSPTGRDGAVHVEQWSSFTALWTLSWWSRTTVFWHYWWLLSELWQCRGSRPTASTTGGMKKLCCIQKWRRRFKAMTLETMTSSIAIHGQKGKVSPQLIRMICFF